MDTSKGFKIATFATFLQPLQPVCNPFATFQKTPQQVENPYTMRVYSVYVLPLQPLQPIFEGPCV